MQSETTAESKTYKTYRRIICCKIHEENVEQFIEVFEDDDWYKVKRLGKRGAEYSYLKSLPNKTRYHMRLYKIDDHYYFLIHHEPTLKGDISFHILGLFDRFRSKKENVLNSEKLELANYEEGIRYFRQELIPKYEILRKICLYAIDEDELKFFAMKFGYISLKLPLEILIEELFEAILEDNQKEFYAIMQKLLSTIEFHTVYTDSEDYLIIESPSLTNFKCLIKKIKVKEIDLVEIGEIIKNHKITTTLLIPRKQDELSSAFIQKLEHLNITIIQPMNLLRIFNIYKNSPILPEQFQELLKPGLIDVHHIEETLQMVDFTDLVQKAMTLFDYLKSQPTWTSQDTLDYEFVKQKNFPKEQLQSILDFLSYPLINLVLVKKAKRRFRSEKSFYRAIKNFDEIQFRLKNIKKFLTEIT